MSKKYINFTFEVLDAPFLEKGKPVADQKTQILQFAQWLGWTGKQPDQYAPEYCPFVIIPAGDPDAEKIEAECKARGQGCIREEMLSKGDAEVIEAENARRAAAYKMECKIAENPAFLVEDACALNILQSYLNQRLQNIPPALHGTFAKQFNEEYEIA